MLEWKYKLLLCSEEQQIGPSTAGDPGASTVPGERVLQARPKEMSVEARLLTSAAEMCQPNRHANQNVTDPEAIPCPG